MVKKNGILLSNKERAALKAAMYSKHIIQQSVADAVNVKQATISAVLCGNNRMSPSYLKTIYQMTGMPEELDFVKKYLTQEELSNLEKYVSSNSRRPEVIPLAVDSCGKRFEECWKLVYTNALERLDNAFEKGGPSAKAAIVNGLEEMVVKYSKN
jgi:transcriptional regulator with XRE-family HTH domain